ncbi:hypothetical protein BKA70DRAFT_1400797 [Coprinopsis sp. MPI-PUGE-AT-0042]|nr:hypothetical protein BKA70DRAFT_1400797 [Coprinopsis sp. MPI-PUGE-AT-0042]
MLGNPTANLSPEIIEEIVDRVELLGNRKDLFSLLNADRAFGDRCRKMLFRKLKVPGGYPTKLKSLRGLFETSPSIPSYVREVWIMTGGLTEPWTVMNADFNRIMDAFATSPRPPQRMRVTETHMLADIKSPLDFSKWLLHSFFASTIVESCSTQAISSPSFTTNSLDEGTGNSPLPELEMLYYGDAHAAMKDIMSATHRPYVSLRRLKCLRVYSHDEKALSHVQAILDQACLTWGEVDLKATPSGSVNLAKLGQLKRLQTKVFISGAGAGGAQANAIHDIACVLSTIPSHKGVLESFSLQIKTYEEAPWNLTRAQNWSSLIDEIGRISGGRVTVFEVEMYAHKAESSESSYGDVHSYVDGILRPAFANVENVDYRWYPICF